MPTFPTQPEELSPDWLTGVLRTRGVLDTAAVSRASWSPVALQGAAGVVGRVVLEYDRDEPHAPGSVVAKFATPHAPIREVMHRFGFYRGEVGFYRELGDDAGIPTPRCFHADIEADTGHFVLVLEDMADARVGDPLRPSLDDVEIAIDHVARFHARWWSHPRLRTFDWVPYPSGAAFEARLEALRQTFTRSTAALRHRLGPAFPGPLSAACDHILGHWPAFIARRLDGAPTLVHRDFHPQQLFFTTEHGGRFAVFDWQTIAIGSGADDVGRLLTAGLHRPDRARHQDRLVDRYYDRLCAEGVEGYARARCREDVRFGLTASLVTNVIALASIDPGVYAEREAASGVSLVYAALDRLAAAFDANDVLALIP